MADGGPWPRPVDEYRLPADGDDAAWRSMAEPYAGLLRALPAPPPPLPPAGAAPSWRERFKACFKTALWGADAGQDNAVPVRVYLLFGLHWRPVEAGEGPPARHHALWAAADDGGEVRSGFKTLPLRRDDRRRRSFDATLALAADKTARVLVIKVHGDGGGVVQAFLADTETAATAWHTRLCRRAAPVELLFHKFPLLVGEAGPAAGASAVGGPSRAAVGRRALSLMAAAQEATPPAVAVVTMLTSPAVTEAIAAAGPAVGLVVGALLGAARSAAAVGGVGEELTSIAAQTADLFLIVSGGLVDLLRSLLAADDPPVPADAAGVLTALLASLTDRLETVSSTSTALAHSRRGRVGAGVAEGGVPELRASLVDIRGDVQQLMGLIGLRTTAQLVARQETVLVALANPQVGTLTTSLSELLASVSAVDANLRATAGRLEASEARMQTIAERMEAATAAEQTATEQLLATYAACVMPKPPSAGIVADWGDPSRPECRALAALAGGGASPPPLAVGVTGMGGLGKSTTLQLVCARLADTGAPDGEHVFRGGSVVWVQLRRGLQEAETKLLLLQATSHLEGRVVSDAGGVWHAASLLGRAAAAAAHDGRPCLLVLDDVWDGCLVPALLSELRDGATGGTSPSGRGSLILFSTRVAAMATGDADITHLPLEGMSAAHGLQVLAAAVAGERHVSPTWATPDEQVAARKLVEYAAGHPLTLSVAGALTRAAMAEDDHGGGLVEALQQLRYNLQAISARTGGAYDSRYSSLWASLMASYEALPLDARFRYRALAVVRSRGRLPLVALGALWGVSAAQALSIAKEFANRSMAALRRGGAGGAPTGAGGGGGPTLEVHDLQLQFAAELCAAEEGGVAAAHEALLRGYARVYDLEPAEQVHPWWTVLREDPYLRGELCRHLASAGRATELRRLLFTWAYVEAQVGWAESPPSSLSIAQYVADCGLEEGAWALAAVVEAAARRGGEEQVAFELHARFAASACDPNDSRSVLLARLLGGVRAATPGLALRVVGPQTVLAPPLVRRYFANASADGDGVATGSDRPVEVTGMAALSPSPHHLTGGGAAGRRVAVGGVDGCVRVFNEDGVAAGSGRPVEVTCMAALPLFPHHLTGGGAAGQRVAVGGVDGSVRVFDLATGRMTAQCIGPSSPSRLRSIVPSPSRRGRLRLLDQTLIYSPVRQVVAVAGGVVTDRGAALPAVVTVSHAGALHVCAADPPAVVHALCLGGSASERALCVAVLDEQLAGTRSEGGMASSPAPASIVAGCDDGGLRIWDVRRGTLKAALAGIPHQGNGPPRGEPMAPQAHPIAQVAVVPGGVRGDAGSGRTGGAPPPRQLVAMTSAFCLFVWSEAPGGWAVTRELHMQHRWASPILCLMGGVPLAGVTGGGLGGATSTEIAAPTVAVVQDVSGHGRGPATHILVGHDVRTGRRVCDVAAPPNVSCATVLRRAAHGGRIRGRAPPTLPPVLAVGDDTGGLTLWDPSGSGLSARVGAHKEGVTALVVVDPAAGSSQPPVLVSAARDGTLAVWHKALGGHAEATSGGPMFSVHACVGDDGFVPGCPAGWDAQGGGLDGGGTALLCTSFVDGSEAVSVRPWAAARDSAVVLSPLPAGDRITSVAVAPLRLPDGRCSPLVAVRTTSEQVWVWQGTAAPAVELGAGNRFLTVQSIPGEGAAGGDGGPSPLVVALTSAGAGYVWDGRTRRVVTEVVPPFLFRMCCFVVVGAALSVGTTPGGRAPLPPLIIGRCLDAGLVVWDATTGRHVRTLGDSRVDLVVATAAPAGGDVTLPAGRRRAIVSATGSVAAVWDVDAGVVLATLDGHADTINHIIAYEAGVVDEPASSSTPGPLMVVTVEATSTLRVWAVGVGVAGVPAPAAPPAPLVLSFPGERVWDVHVLDAARGLLVACLDKAVSVMDVLTATVVARVSLLGRVDDLAVAGPAAVAVVTEGSLVHLALTVGPAS